MLDVILLHMKIEIDQSGKVEKTSVPTVIADSLGNYVWITPKDKAYLQEFFRISGKPRMFIIKTFAVLVTFLILQSKKNDNHYQIDTEYIGLESEIKSFLLLYLYKHTIQLDKERISFKQITKKSMAHEYAIQTYRALRKDSPNRVSLRQVLQFIA